jgi:hypothetical protein
MKCVGNDGEGMVVCCGIGVIDYHSIWCFLALRLCWVRVVDGSLGYNWIHSEIQ